MNDNGLGGLNKLILSDSPLKEQTDQKRNDVTISDAGSKVFVNNSAIRGQSETPFSHDQKPSGMSASQIQGDIRKSAHEKITTNLSNYSSQSNRSVEMNHARANSLITTNKLTNPQPDKNSSQPIMNLFNKSYNTSSHGITSPNQDKNERTEPNQKSNTGKQDFSGKSVSEIMSFIQHKINLDIHKKIRDVPEALPLIRRISHLNMQEDDLFKKVRVGQQNQNRSQIEPNNNCCYHDEIIEDWKCKKCDCNISKFDIFFDDQDGQVTRFTDILYENQFLQDFKYDFQSKSQVAATQDKDAQQVLLYKQYQPQNTLQLKEYNFMIMSKTIKKQNQEAGDDASKYSPFGTGEYKNLSGKLLKYIIGHNERRKRLKEQYGNQILLFDSLFESGNLLQAERNGLKKDTYNLFMQVDTNTRGHQQWFYFRVKGGIKDKTYTFQIMNFTKPGVTGGRGYKNGEHDMRIFVRSKKTSMQISDFKQWESLKNCCYIKTGVSRRKKDVIAAGADSDQEEWVEKAFQSNTNTMNVGRGEQQQIPNISMTGPQEISRNAATQEGASKVEKPKKRKTFYYYALQFQYTFKHDDDSVYFAFSQPVTYTEILNDLHNWEKKMQPKGQLTEKINNLKKQVNNNIAPKKLTQKEEEQLQKIPLKNRFKKEIVIENNQTNIYYKREEFCRSISGLPLQKIVIARDYRSSLKNKTVLITSRVHSGETPGSQVFKGIFDFLTSDYREAKYLRRFYTFILIPVMNPDGVVCGNYRNSLAGVDLNRQWINPEKSFHPEVCAVKDMMQQIKEEDKRHIWIYCDLHGHSKKNNSFFYGCNTAANGGFLSWTIVRLLPRIFAQKTHMFNYKDCRFRVEPYKIGTARIVAWKQFQITHSFTLENSFYGYDIGEDESKAFTEDDYRMVGAKFILSIYEMHGMWKQIKRELNITHGWLKPRTLNDLTGVPAAQIIAEEAAKKKEEERKQKAILQYEEFLRKFYKEKKPIIRHIQAYKEQNQPFGSPSKKIAKFRTTDQKLEDMHDLVDDDQPIPENYAQKKIRSDDGNNDDLECVQDDPESANFVQAKAKLPTITPDEEEETEKEFMFKMHQGLVKIQALIRGFLAKIKVNKKREEQMKKKRPNIINNIRSRQESGSNSMKRQRSNHILANSSKKFKYQKANLPSQTNLKTEMRTGQSGGTGGFETSSDGGVKGTATGTSKHNNLDSSNDEQQLMRANTEQIPQNFSDTSITKISIESTGNMTGSRSGIFGQLRKDPIRMEWRNFFEEDELNRAYQIVEVEQRDETDNDCSDESMGSNSDPSEDNFDEDEVYRKVYKLDNPKEHIEARKQKEQEFIDQVQTEQISQEALMNQLKSEFMSLNEIKEMEKNETFINHVKKKQSKNEIELDQFSKVFEEVNDQKENEEQTKQIQFQKSNLDLEIFSNEALMKKASNKLSIKQSPSNMNDFQQENMILENQNNRRMLKSSAQQRVLTQQSNNNLTRTNFNQHSRLVQQSYYKLQQSLNHKKPNMNQVIKDCFIIKRMGSNNNPVHNSQNINSSSKLKHLHASSQNMHMFGQPPQAPSMPHFNQTMHQNNVILTPGAKYSSSSKKSAYMNHLNQNLKVMPVPKQHIPRSNIAFQAGPNKNQIGHINVSQLQGEIQSSNQDQSIASQAIGSNSMHSYQLRMHDSAYSQQFQELPSHLSEPAKPQLQSAQKRLNSQVNDQLNFSQLVQGQLGKGQPLYQNQKGLSVSKLNKGGGGSDSKSNSVQFNQGPAMFNQGIEYHLSHLPSGGSYGGNHVNNNMRAVEIEKDFLETNQQILNSQQQVNSIQQLKQSQRNNQRRLIHGHEAQIQIGPNGLITLASTGQHALTEKQASQLVNQLNQYMKNMTPNQAIEFLRMIQDKSIYLATSSKSQFANTNLQFDPNMAPPMQNNLLQIPQQVDQTHPTGQTFGMQIQGMQQPQQQPMRSHVPAAEKQPRAATISETPYRRQTAIQSVEFQPMADDSAKEAQLLGQDRVQQSSTQIMRKKPYFNQAAAAQQNQDGISSTALGIKKNFDISNQIQNPNAANRYYYSSKNAQNQKIFVQQQNLFKPEQSELAKRQGRNLAQTGQTSNKLVMKEKAKPPSASRVVKTSKILNNNLLSSPGEKSLKVTNINFNKSNQGITGHMQVTSLNKSLNRTFYNQQSSTSHLQKVGQDQQIAQQTVHSHSHKKPNKKESSSIQQNNSSEYDLGAALFTKYVKKKASLQQANSYQQFQ